MRRILAAAVASLALVTAASQAGAQAAYPTRPIRVVVGFGPGAAADIAARLVGQKLGDILGQPVVVENKPGGGSNVAADMVARSPKDGYTLFFGTVANAINATLTPNLSFDFRKDFAPVALVVTLPNILVVHPSLGVTNVRDLIALVKTKPGEIFFASSGVGTSPHLSGELFNEMAGVKLTHVPYQGSAQAVTDLIAGRVQVMFSPPSTVLPQVEEGTLKALASTEVKRASVAPNLPTMDEAGLKGFDTSLWFGLLAPADTPADIVDKLAKGLNTVLADREVLAVLRVQGMDPLGGTPQEFGSRIASEIDKWAKVAKAAGLVK